MTTAAAALESVIKAMTDREATENRLAWRSFETAGMAQPRHTASMAQLGKRTAAAHLESAIKVMMDQVAMLKK